MPVVSPEWILGRKYTPEDVRSLVKRLRELAEALSWRSPTYESELLLEAVAYIAEINRILLGLPDDQNQVALSVANEFSKEYK